MVQADRGAGSGPRSTESREENEGKLWSGGGGRKKQSTSLSGGDALCRQETLSLILGPLSADRASEEAPARRVIERPAGRTRGDRPNLPGVIRTEGTSAPGKATVQEHEECWSRMRHPWCR